MRQRSLPHTWRPPRPSFGCCLAVAFSLFVGAVSGCATTRYTVGVDGYLAVQDIDLRAVSIGVVQSDLVANPLQAQEAKEKIEELLTLNGYDVVEPDAADVLLLNAFGIGSPQETGGGVVVPLAGMLAYVPSSAVRYFRWLVIGVASPEAISQTESPSDQVPWIWLAEVTSSGRSGDLREVLDFMLVAAFEYFGQATHRREVVELTDRDRRVLELRGTRR